MWVVVETTRGTKFSIQLNRHDKVLDIKKRIEKSQRIDVSTQELYHKGEPLLVDDHDLKTYNIVKDSRILLVLPVLPQAPAPSNYPVLPQAPGPSNDATNMKGFLGKNQGWPQMHHQTEPSQVPPSNAIEAFFNTSSVEDQMRLKSLLNSCSLDDLHELLEPPWTDQDMSKMQGFWPASTTEGNANVQEPSRRNDNNQDLLQRESSNTFGGFSSGEVRPLSTEEIIKKNQVFQKEQSLVPSSSAEQRINTKDLLRRFGRNDRWVQTKKPPPIREVIDFLNSHVKVENLEKPPQKMRVMVLLYSPDIRMNTFPVYVNASDKVKEIRKELEKMKIQLDLPQKGYFFKHKERTLDEDQSFHWNGVVYGDTIEILPGQDLLTKRMDLTFGL